VVRFRLPVSGLDVTFRQTTGAEDILIVEQTALDIHLALDLLSVLGKLSDGGAVPWKSLPVPDLDAALLAIRRFLIGEHVRASVICAAANPLRPPNTRRGQAGESTAGCLARIDIAFCIDDYLAHHAPAVPRGILPADEPGWFRLDGTDVTGRLVSCADQLAIAGRKHAERELALRCIRPATASIRLRRRMEAAIAKLAPSLYDELDGRCPECSATVRIFFDPLRYVLSELRDRAMFVYQEVHLIASRYQWSEREILALPRARRARYAEYVHEAGAVA
jgi:hypothetical protein